MDSDLDIKSLLCNICRHYGDYFVYTGPALSRVSKSTMRYDYIGLYTGNIWDLFFF